MVVVLVYDVLIVIGVIVLIGYFVGLLGIFGFGVVKIMLLVVVVFLMIIGYLFNDMIVVFDWICEVCGKNFDLIGEMINCSIG